LILVLRSETAGRLAIIEVSDSAISESRPTCGMANALMRNAPMALLQNKECCIKDIINKVILISTTKSTDFVDLYYLDIL
jgi:hypothetical protein